jgi:hypothetical protein
MNKFWRFFAKLNNADGEGLSVGSWVGTHGGCQVGGIQKKLCVMKLT